MIPTVDQRYGFALALLLGLVLLSSPSRGDDQISPATMEKMQQLLVASDAVESYGLVVANSTAQYDEWLEAANPGRHAEIDQFVKEFLIPRIKVRLPEYYQQMARIYAKHLQPDEVDQLIAFYESPLGRKLVAARKAAIPELVSARHAWWTQMERSLLQDLTPELQKRGLTIPHGTNG